MAGYIVQIQEDAWLAPWSGDPGRTFDVKNAKIFKSNHAAICALSRAKRVFPRKGYKEARIVKCVPVLGVMGSLIEEQKEDALRVY